MESIKGGKLKVEAGVVKIDYGVTFDGDQDGRSAGGMKAEAFLDLPELLDEAMKDNATAQMLAKWIDLNKGLLPAVEKAI